MHSPGHSPAHGLEQEHQAASALLQLLLQEQSRLVEADVDGLLRITGEKAALANRIADLARERYARLGTAGFEASENGMLAWLDSGAATAQEKGSWNTLLSVAKSVKEQNRVNGLLIARHMARNQSALNVLQGNTQDGGFYGPSGQSATKIGSRHLVVG